MVACNYTLFFLRLKSGNEIALYICRKLINSILIFSIKPADRKIVEFLKEIDVMATLKIKKRLKYCRIRQL